MAKTDLTPYSTDNTYHAAYLRAIGGKLIDIDRSDERHFVYFFQLTSEQEELAPAYFCGGPVCAIAYADSHKNLMRIIKSGEE